jgi:hypothetical protein
VSLAKSLKRCRIMRLRDDVQVTGGEVTLGVTSRRNPARTQLASRSQRNQPHRHGARAGRHLGTAAGRRHYGRRHADRPVLQQVTCRSDFLLIEG